MRFVGGIGLGLIIVLFAACGTPVRTFSEADATTDFSGLRTYGWRDEGVDMQPPDGASNSPGVTALTLQSIRDAVGAGLAERGLRPSDPPDVLVGVRAGTRERLQTTFWARDPLIDQRFGPNPGWPLTDRRTVNTVEESLIAIDIFDAKTGKALWSGIGSTPAALTANDRQTLDEVVAEILRDFPPKPAQ
ncbi:MAG: DUF4136 domain-containing protein [Rhodospirillales bacterium]|nr:DUF4136 domain-containing protein [Rhodospirillales bacterium]